MFSRLYLEITTCCNRACSFCPGTARPAAFVTPETFRTLAAKLRPYGQYLYLHVMGEPLLHREGHRGGTWVLLDFGCLVVHVFTEETRAFYDLERLWNDATPVPIDFAE